MCYERWSHQMFQVVCKVEVTRPGLKSRFLRLLFLQAHRETEAHFTTTNHWNSIATQPIGVVPFLSGAPHFTSR
jgi:hypothetical protein